MKDNRLKFSVSKRTDIENKKYKVVTRDGKDVRILCWDAFEDYPIIAVVGKNQTIDKYRADGKYMSNGEKCSEDLFLENNLTPWEKRCFNFRNVSEDLSICSTKEIDALKDDANKLYDYAKELVYNEDVQPKFKVGDVIRKKNPECKAMGKKHIITYRSGTCYSADYYEDDNQIGYLSFPFTKQDEYELVSGEEGNIVKTGKLGYVARNKNGCLRWFAVLPSRQTDIGAWWDRDYDSFVINNELYPELTWEDEPIQVEILLVTNL